MFHVSQFVAGFLLFAVTVCDAQTCYSCSYSTLNGVVAGDERCRDSFNSAGVATVDCTSFGGCAKSKTVYNSGRNAGRYAITRSCGNSVPFCSYTYGTGSNSSYSESGEGWSCVCTGSNCNSAHQIKSGSLVAPILTAAVLLTTASFIRN